MAKSEAKDEQIESIANDLKHCDAQLQAMKRGGGARKNLTLAKADELNKSSEFGDNEGSSKLKDDLSALQREFRKRMEEITQDLKMLMPLVNGAVGDTPKSDLEVRLTNKIVQMTTKQSEKMFSLKSDLDDLKQKFDEKIRRQGLVAAQKKNYHADDSGERGEVAKKPRGEKRPMFLAQQMTRELALNGKLPQLESYGDYIARYGKGFSQMIAMADSCVTSPRLVASPQLNTVSHEVLSDAEQRHPRKASTLSQKQIKPVASHPEFRDQPNAPETTARVHPNLKGTVFKLKKSEAKNRTSLVQPPNTSSDLPGPQQTAEAPGVQQSQTHHQPWPEEQTTTTQ